MGSHCRGDSQHASQGRPVLIGTRTIEKSEILSKLLQQLQIPHQVLNAHKVAEEAAIVPKPDAADASPSPPTWPVEGRHQVGRRGSRIGRTACDLHRNPRFCTHRSPIGGTLRATGDPGSVRQYQVLDDEILEAGYGRKTGPSPPQREADASANYLARYATLFRKAQRKVERQQLRQRNDSCSITNKQRKRMQEELGQDPYLDTPH